MDSGVLKILKILDFIAKTRHFFPKKLFSWNFGRKKLKISKIRDSHLLELFNYYLLSSFLAIRFSNVFLTNFQTFIFFAPKSWEVTSQNRLYLNLFCPNRFFTPNDVELMSGESCQVSCRYLIGFRSFPENRVGRDTPSRRLRVNPLPAGPLNFPPPAGGWGVWTPPPPMISAPSCREKQKAAFERSRKIIS